MHYERWRVHGETGTAERRHAEPVVDAAGLFARASERGGCLEWTGGVDKYGYGRVGGGGLAAHRAAWEFTHGPIPAGLCVLHKCDNPPCINPDHLFLGTQGDNSADKVAKGRQARGETQGNAKLTDAAVVEIRSSALSGASLGLIFGVAPETINRARRGETWKHIPMVWKGDS